MNNKIRCGGIKLALLTFAEPQGFVRRREENEYGASK
jgi:hypothetical protein